MKKTKNKEILESILNKEELSILKGGARNINQVSTCNCDYNDTIGLTNKNTVGGCSCTCVDPSNPGS